VFGLVVASFMGLIGLWHRRNTFVYKDEVDQLMNLARSDGHHHGDGHAHSRH
jgi:MFS transporter, LPLT family, lysophospholipid transporter